MIFLPLVLNRNALDNRQLGNNIRYTLRPKGKKTVIVHFKPIQQQNSDKTVCQTPWFDFKVSQLLIIDLLLNLEVGNDHQSQRGRVQF